VESQSILIQSRKTHVHQSVPVANQLQTALIQVTGAQRNSISPERQLRMESQSIEENQNIDKSQNHECLQEMILESGAVKYPVNPEPTTPRKPPALLANGYLNSERKPAARTQYCSTARLPQIALSAREEALPLEQLNPRENEASWLG
jgi:hypothetical protein